MMDAPQINRIETLPLFSFAELPFLERKDFDYIDKPGADAWQPRLVRYLGTVYDIYDTQGIFISEELRQQPMGWGLTVKPGHPFESWHSFISDSYFSGVLFRIEEDDTVTCGTYIA